MNKLFGLLGRPAYWLSWPLLYVYLRKSTRTRVLLIADNKALLVQNWLGSTWALPGGGLHSGEDSRVGAVREVREETGITLQPEQLQYLGSERIKHHGFTYQIERFVAELPQAFSPQPQQFEISQAKWFPLNEIANNRLAIDVENTIKIWSKGLNLVE